MSTLTEQYPDFTGMTFEKVWAAIQESRAESNERMDRLEKSLTRSEAIAARASHAVGELGNRFGEVIERLVSRGAVDLFNTLGFHFTYVVPNPQIRDPETGKTLTEIDLVLENGDAVAVIEVKVKPSKADVNKHIKRMNLFRDDRKQRHPTEDKKIFGAMAAPVFDDDVREAALEAGFYIIEQSGKSIVFNVPKGFEPKTF